MGGLEFIVPAQATVIALGLPCLSAHDTKTAGTGFNIVDGFHNCFAIFTSPFYTKFTA